MSEAQKDCIYLESCVIFKYFCTYPQVYIEIYCQGDYQACERYQLRLAGQTPSDNLLPHGGLLQGDN
ncbi:hypothetical protein ACFLYO_07090 [Chloroflexota bacterium]